MGCGDGGACAGGEGRVSSETLGELELGYWCVVTEWHGRDHLDLTSALPRVGGRERLGLLGEGEQRLLPRRNAADIVGCGWEGAWNSLEARQEEGKEGKGV